MNQIDVNIIRTEKNANKIAKELGEKIDKKLGRGDFGTAFLLQSGKVLKLTSDENEINMAQKLTKNKNLFTHVINYYNVGEIGDSKETEKYFILMDYVEPLERYEKIVIGYVYQPLLQWSHSFYKSVMSDQFVDYVENMFADYKLNSKRTGLDIKVLGVDKIKKIALELIPQIKNIAKELKLHKIDMCDFHSGNLGWNQDHTKLIIFDLSKPYKSYDRPEVKKLKLYEYKDFYSQNSQINKRIDELAEELGEEIEKFLDKGAFGYAFKTKSNKVLKITSDTNEVHIAHKLAKHKNWIKSLVNYYNVGKLLSKNQSPYLDINYYQYYILMDYTEPLSKEEERALDCYMKPMQYKLDFYSNMLDEKDILDHIEYLYGESNSIEYIGAIKDKLDPEKIKQIAIDLYPKVLTIAKDLKRHNIKETDFHGGNIGWDKNHENLVLFDIGGQTNTNYRSKGNFKKITVSEKLITKFKNF